MKPPELRARIERFADGVINFCRSESTDVLSLRLLTQLQDSATSAAANYRAACRGQTRAAFIAKLSVALEEADEAQGWLHQLSNARIGDRHTVAELLQEAGEICAILSASRKTAQRRRRRDEGQ